MKIHKCKQGDAHWMGLRCGLPTASKADCIITPTGAAVKGAKRDGLLYELTAEKVSGMVEMHFVTAAMERGIQLEPEARSWYSLAKDCDVQEVGFVDADSGRWGCSPDGLIGDDGGLEIKCCERKAHVAALVSDKPPTQYLPQVLFSMMTTRRKWWDLAYYTNEPCLPNRVFRIEADPEAMERIEAAVVTFCDDLAAMVAKVEEQRL